MDKFVTIDGKPFKVGEEVFFKPWDSREHSRIVKIQKIGLKYMFFGDFEEKVFINTLCTPTYRDNGYRYSNGKIYASEDHYNRTMAEKEEHHNICKEIEKKFRNCNLSQLKKILMIIDNQEITKIGW